MLNNLVTDLNFEEISAWVASINEPAYRAKQLWQGIYKQAALDIDKITNLPKDFKSKIKDSYLPVSLLPQTSISSNDSLTTKVLFSAQSNAYIEAVLMRYEERNTVCISTQSGCAMNCAFCATGRMGFTRNLSSGEILSQVLYFESLLHKENASVTNVVLMGMGEPFNNYDASLKAIYTLNNPEGFNLGVRRFTISTVGIIPRITQFADEKHQVNLAISLHSADNDIRSQLVPINRFYPLPNLIESCKYYTSHTHRRVTFEYALISGINDGDKMARDLAALLKGILCHVNLIALNPIKGSPYQPPSKEQVHQFNKILNEKGIPSTVRLRRGIEIQAGCGQLAYEKSGML